MHTINFPSAFYILVVTKVKEFRLTLQASLLVLLLCAELKCVMMHVDETVKFLCNLLTLFSGQILAELTRGGKNDPTFFSFLHYLSHPINFDESPN